MTEDKFNLNKKEKKDLAEHLYKEEEDRWSNATAAYYRPRGAPGRLDEDLLEQYHRQNNTGVQHPQDLNRVLVKVMFDELSYSIKHFLTEHGAKEYMEKVGHYGVVTELVEEESLPSILGGF